MQKGTAPQIKGRHARPETTLYIGITGAFGSGCTESAKYLAEKHSFHRVSLSEILKRESRGSPKRSRKGLQDVGNKIRDERGPHILMDLALAKVIENEASMPNRVVIETIRNPFEVEHLISTVPNAYILALYASQDERIRRTNSESKIQRQNFMKADMRDSGENETEYGQQVTDCVNMADYFIDNSGTKQHLKDDLDRFVGIVSGKEDHEAQPDEVMMSHAFMQRLLSRCLARRVGAVISKNGSVVSTGWNDVSRGRESCRGCHRKAIRKCERCGADLLQDLGKCPNPKCRHLSRERKKNLEKHLDLCYAVHAEERAILHAAKAGISLSETVLYCTTFPCLLCAKMIAESGIQKVVYVEPYPSSDSEAVLKAAGIKYERFRGFTARRLYGVHAMRRTDNA